MIKKLIIITLMIFSFASVAASQPVFAADLFHGDSDNQLCEGEAANSAACTDKTDTNPVTGSNGLLAKITNIIAFVAGAAAVIVLVVGGIRYITSGGNGDKVASAKAAVTNAIIGLIVIVLGRTLILYVINRL